MDNIGISGASRFIPERWAESHVSVATVLRRLASGLTERQILSEYPDLEMEDIRECLRFAAASAMERELPLPPPTPISA